MLAKLTHDHFSGEDGIFERKLDGESLKPARSTSSPKNPSARLDN